MKFLKSLDANKYLFGGNLTQPFLDDDFVLNKVMSDYEAKIKTNPNTTKLHSLMAWIHHNVKSAKGDRDFINRNKFQRTSQEIWQSKIITGCTDYAMLFATFARQIGIATTFLHTAEKNWLERLKNGDKSEIYYGHSFCECFYENKWVLVDPTYNKIQYNYNPKLLELNYKVGEYSVFVPYFRGLDLGEKQTLKQHNDKMDELCKLKK